MNAEKTSTTSQSASVIIQHENQQATKNSASDQEPVKSTCEQEAPPAAGHLEEVMCDSCIETPHKASKSCQTCMVSYCMEHLRPHLENSKFQSHKLVEPQLDMEQRTCEHHHLELELYCMEDNHCVCPQCQTDGHQGHSITPIDKARKDIEVELQQKQKEMTKTLSAAEQAFTKLQSDTTSMESSVAGVHTIIQQQFAILQGVIEDARKNAVDSLEGEQKQALGQAVSIQTHLQQKISELKKTISQVERLSRNKNGVDFLQEYKEWKKGSVDISLPEIYISLIDRLTTFSNIVKESTQKLCDLLQTTYKIQLKELCKSETLAIKTQVLPSSPSKQQEVGTTPVTREDFLKYATNLSFNPDSTHQYLRLTEDNRKASNTTPWQHNYPDLPERFEHWRQVMTTESLYLGRHYFEVQLRGEGAYVGLTYKSIDRKGQDNSSSIRGNDFSWCVGQESHAYSAWHADVETPLEVDEGAEFPRIGCYIDYEMGLIAFYGVEEKDTQMHLKLLQRYSASFREPLHPAFWLSKKDNAVVLCKPGE